MKTALITGASSGIGAEFARTFAKRGYRLILAARRRERLEALREELGVPCTIYTADFSSREDTRRFIRDIAGEKIDVFINNAGFGTCGTFLETDLEKETDLIEVNCVAMHMLFKAVLRHMTGRNKGIILNVASSAGLLPGGPYMAAYYASKAYVVSLTRAVARELKELGSQVYVCALCPGPVDTEFNEHADVIFSLKGISAQTCVREAIAGMNRHAVIIVPTCKVQAGIFASKLLPMPIVMDLVGRQQKSKFQE